ncbi:TonB-dependent receptor [Lacibacter sediminis]|uniref:TonB-dependent receptor n=1 Tax=Lacibacter sediminis TaxID=2760713 RepID=A0A7G5XEZ4_9BACT|nr:TonB-dependent receptor [Lacibacter sediminis]QNA44047.1 TonB-dependent receptor [Lacibacter sediminis]
MKAFTLLISLIIAQLAFGQTTISGTVLDNKKKPVAGASIAIKDSYDGATADSVGRFRFKTTDKGSQVIIITAIGFKTVELPVELKGGDLQLPVQLKEEVTEMSAVVITAGAFEASDRKRVAAVLSSIDIVTTASANADITGALKTLPGAQQVGESEGLFVRGGTAAETKTFIDGTLVNNFFFSSVPGIAQRGRFSPFIFKGTVFSTGGYSALYGQALSSALILESIDLPEQSSATLNLSVLGIGAGFQKLNKEKTASWGVNYNYSNLTAAFAVIKQQQDYSKAPNSHNIDANFRIKTSKNGILKYYGFYLTNSLGFTQNSLDSLGYKDRFGLSNGNMYHNLSWKESLKNKWKLQAGVSVSTNKDDIRFGMQDEDKNDVVLTGLEFKQFEINSKGFYANGRLVLEKKFRALNALRFGVEYNHSDDKSLFTAFNGSKFRTRLIENVYSLFAEQDVYLTNKLAAKFGARAEYSALLDKTNLAPRVSLAYKLGKESQASLAYGIFYQNPELRYQPTIAPLTFMKATHYIAQYQKTTSLTTFRVEAFYKQYDNLIKTSNINGRELGSSNNGFGDASGFELFWRDKKTVNNLDYWISYSFLNTKRDFLNFPTAITPNFAAKHTGSFVVKKFVTKLKSNLNFSYNYASGRPYYNIQYDQNTSKPFFADKGRIPDYHNVSFSVNYLPSIGKKNAKAFAVYVLSVSNVFNIKQVYGYNYSYNGQRKTELVPPSRMFIFIGAFISFGVDRTDDAINNNL